MKISYGELKQCTEEMRGIVQTINEIFENVSLFSNEIVRGESWIGEAEQFYVNKLNSVASTFDDIYLELNKSVLYLDKVTGQYESVDANVSSASRNFGNNIAKNTISRLD